MLGFIPEKRWQSYFIEFSNVLKKVNRGCGNPKLLKDISYLQIFTSESRYPDHTKLQFDIDGPYLFRYKHPFIKTIDYPRFILKSHLSVLPLNIIFTGIDQKKTAVMMTIIDDKGMIISRKKQLVDSRQLQTFISIKGLPTGNYKLTIQLTGAKKNRYFPFEILDGLQER
jgi:hypothetical protein